MIVRFSEMHSLFQALRRRRLCEIVVSDDHGELAPHATIDFPASHDLLPKIQAGLIHDVDRRLSFDRQIVLSAGLATDL
jgi:hypothetical protein